VPFVSPFLDRPAFEALCDRHESGVFNFCLRTTGSRDIATAATKAAFLEVCRDTKAPARDGADPLVRLLAVARREATRLTETPGKSDPPAGSPLRIREANGRLDMRHREALALRELLGRTYGEIGQVVGADRDTVAELLWHARLELRDELEGSTLLSIAPLAGSCRRALALIVMNFDGELEDSGERTSLQRHLRTCGKCRLSQEAARRASASYREWLPAATPLGLRASLMDAAPNSLASPPADRPAGVSGT
jgi:DNA-directed RNA polymerase specialized sigma24 family protein